ncbi:MAG: hypothetical protein AB1454_02870 [Candidatus Auribacterota bacterium]
MVTLTDKTYEYLSERRDYLPDNWKRTLEENRVPYNPSSFIRERTDFPLFEFPCVEKKVIFSKPIKVNIYKEDGWFFAENDTLNIFAVGETKEQAICEFSTIAIDMYEDYINTPDTDLTGLALKLKRIYQECFSELA